MTKSLDQSALEITTEEEYRALTRSLRRRKGFGIIFVQCTPVGGKELITKVETDLPNKNIGVLELDAPIENLIERVAALPNQEQLNIVFISGLEKSLVEYIRPGYGGVGDYYKLDTVPPILNHLNWQRENFRDRFRHLCFVFLLPPFAVKYILHRAPDFADWRSGIVDVPTDQQLIEQETHRLWLEGDFEKYRQWTEQQRLERIGEIQTYLAANPDLERVAELWFEQGNILVANEEYEAAVSSFEQAIKAKPNQPIQVNPLNRFFERLLNSKVPTIIGFHQAWYNRGIALFNLGRYEEAIISYERALDINPDKDEAWNNRGAALVNLGRYEEAITSYEQALKIKPDDYEAWFNCGTALVNLGRYEEAITSYERALKIKPDYQAWNNHGIALVNLGRYEEAITSYERALKIKPDDYEAWFNDGIALVNLGRYEEAITSYGRALKIKPDYQAWNNHGIALVNLGRYEEAITSYGRALKIKPDVHQAWYNKACTYAIQNKIDLALQNLEKAILLDTNYCNTAKEDSDFDNIRQDVRFQKLLEKYSPEN